MSTEVQTKIDSIARDWEEFKKANDAGRTELADAIKNGIAETKKEIAEIKTTMRETQIKEVVGQAKDEGKAVWNDWIRTGEGKQSFINTSHAKKLREMKGTGYNITTGADGGYGVPTVIEEAISRIIQETSPVRQVTAPVTIGGSTGYIKLLDNNDATAGWVTELGTRTGTNANTFTKVTIVPYEYYANPQISLEMLEDVQFDAEAELTASIADKLARLQNTAFVLGSGSGQPTGFLSATTNDLGSEAASVSDLNTIASGTADAIVADDILNLIYNLRAGYRVNGVFTMHRLTELAVMSLKDSYGRYMWQPNYAAEQPATLAGYPVVEFDDMPSATTDNALVITFADWKNFYRPVDRIGLQMLRDPYTVEGSVVYKTRGRVGGGIENGIAGVTLKILAAS